MPVIRINGCYEQVAEVTERAMNGELDFNESLVERVKCLKGAPESVFDDVYNVIELTPGAEEFVWALQVWSETPIRDNSRCCCHPLTGVPCLRLGPCRAVLRRGARAAGRRGGAAGVPGQQRRGGRRRGEHRRDFRGRCGPAQLKRRHAGGLDRVDHLFSGASTGVIFAGGAVQRNSGASDTASSR